MTGFFTHILTNLADIDRMPVAVAALVLTSVLGLITGAAGQSATPLIWSIWQRPLAPLARRLNRPSRSAGALLIRGGVFTVCAILFAVIVGRIFTWTAARIPHFALMELILLCTLISSGALWRIGFSLRDNKDAQNHLSHTAFMTVNSSDMFAANRIMCNTLIHGLYIMTCAPLFWYYIGGLPMACIYSIISALMWRTARATPTITPFMRIFGAIDKLMGLIPYFISALCLTSATIISAGAKPIMAARAWLKPKHYHAQHQATLLLAIAAYGLNISLGGAGKNLDNVPAAAHWVGPKNASAKITQTQLRRALYLTITAHMIFAALISACYFGISS